MHTFLAYLRVRFPLLPLLFFALLTTTAVGSSVGSTSWLRMMSQACILVCFLFHLRILDEFKDEEFDGKYHAYRPLQTGMVRHKDLVLYGSLNAVFLSGLSYLAYASAFAVGFFLVSWLYTLLMYREFGISRFWERSPFWYVVSHEVCLILLYASFFTASVSMSTSVLKVLSEIPWPHLFFVFIPMLLLELGRKIRPRLDARGRSTPDTYSARWGETRTIIFTTTLPLAGLLPLAISQEISLQFLWICLSFILCYGLLALLRRVWFVRNSFVLTSLYAVLLLGAYILRP